MLAAAIALRVEGQPSQPYPVEGHDHFLRASLSRRVNNIAVTTSEWAGFCDVDTSTAPARHCVPRCRCAASCWSPGCWAVSVIRATTACSSRSHRSEASRRMSAAHTPAHKASYPKTYSGQKCLSTGTIALFVSNLTLKLVCSNELWMSGAFSPVWGCFAKQ